MLRSFSAIPAATAFACIILNPALAQENYPDRLVTVVVPYSPGGSTDVVTRVIAEKLTAKLGQSVVVENLTGAGGAIAWGNVAKSPADGYRVLTTDLTLSFAPSLFPDLGVNPQTSFDHVSIAASVPHVLVVNPSLTVSSVAELVEKAKARPEEILFASGGVGTNTHVTAELFQSFTGTKMTHIPYQGAGAAVTDIIRGDTQVLFTAVPTVLQHIQSGALRPLMVTSDKRIQALPDVPSAVDVGLPEMNANFWVGYAMPAGSPSDAERRFGNAVAEIVKTPEVTEQLAKLGYQSIGFQGREAQAFIDGEIERWGSVIQQANIKAE